jgi:hypothetical protein
MNDLPVTIEVVQGDVLDFAADILALKYAQHFYGADEAVSSLLIARGVAKKGSMQPQPGLHVWIDSRGALLSPWVLFVGVPNVWELSYSEIENFIFRALSVVAQDCPNAKHVAITLNGPGTGLDEIEALYSEVRGIVRSVESGKSPAKLTRITIVNRHASRVARLQAALSQLTLAPRVPAPRTASSPTSMPPIPIPPTSAPVPASAAFLVHRSPEPAPSNLQSAEQVELKPRAFVAMPFAPEMEDVFYYGIQNPVRQLGYVCERCSSLRRPNRCASTCRASEAFNTRASRTLRLGSLTSSRTCLPAKSPDLSNATLIVYW